MEDNNNQSTQFDLSFNKYIERNLKVFYNRDNVIEKENIEDLICPICFFVLKNPISCSNNKSAHSFCKECIDKYLKENNKCPTCKLIFGYKINNNIYNDLNNLSFQCEFKNEGCNIIIPYSDYLIH